MKLENNMDLENKIINTDALKVIKDMPSESIDLVVTDPPYKVISGA